MGLVSVPLGNGRDYAIHIGSGVMQSDPVWEKLDNGQVIVITNAKVKRLHIDSLMKVLGDGIEVIEIGDGEKYKNLDSYGMVIDQLVSKKLKRNSTIVALGGGVVGDLAGFVAATYQRGIKYVQVPTTLLAQVDSSVGGKTAINHAGGKNLIGAFYQPEFVVADVTTLSTLPQREYISGMAEVVKYGVISDSEFFSWIEKNCELLIARDLEALSHAVTKSCLIKSDFVSKDERELDLRALLNFGHTFGHAIELLTDYEKYLHGEAVSIGMVMAAEFSHSLNLLNRSSVEKIRLLLDRFGLPVQEAALDVREMIEAMSMDKKALDKTLRFIVAERIGRASVCSLRDTLLLEQMLSRFFSSSYA